MCAGDSCVGWGRIYGTGVCVCEHVVPVGMGVLSAWCVCGVVILCLCVYGMHGAVCMWCVVAWCRGKRYVVCVICGGMVYTEVVIV